MRKPHLRLEHEKSPSAFWIRVTYHLIRKRYRENPDFFQPYPPSAVLALAQEYRLPLPIIYPWFAFYARNMANGLTCDELRDMLPENTVRAVFKRRAVPRTRR